MSEKIKEYLTGVKKVAITGHVSPDGDCAGSCLGMWNYIKDNYPDIEAHVYLQEYKDNLHFLKGTDEVRHSDKGEDYDLLILLDISSKTRLSFAESILKRTKKTLCIDHHLTNPGGFTWFFNEPEASSASEVLFTFLDPEKISLDCAVCLYTGIVHDTGVFQYSSTSRRTMEIAGILLDKGVPFTKIIEESFFQVTFAQNQALGYVLSKAKLHLDGFVVSGVLLRDERLKMGLKTSDLDTIVAQLRNTKGADVAVFIYQLDDGYYKISMRSSSIIDVSVIAGLFDGGGHIRAAGCRTNIDPDKIIETVLEAVKEQLN